MHNLIINKSVAILEASKRIVNTQCVKISVLANIKKFKNVMTLVISTSGSQGAGNGIVLCSIPCTLNVNDCISNSDPFHSIRNVLGQRNVYSTCHMKSHAADYLETVTA